MWKLTIEDDEAKQTSLPLAHDEYGIGRAEQNAIRLTDRNVSRKHATLVRNAQAWIVRDLESYNGTFVNGLRVAGEQHVNSGDVVQLGDYRLELLDEAKAIESTAPGQLPVHQRPDRLVVVVGPTPGAEFPLDRDHFSIGRAEDADVSINHSSVSRFHAELIAVGNGRYEIIDKNSANGIRINGQEVKRGFLEPGDALELGDVRCRFVGRGKIFRPGADQTQQLTAVASFESVAPSVRAPVMQGSAPKSTGIGKFIFIGALLGLVAIVIMLVAMRTTTPMSTDDPDDKPDKVATTDEDSARGVLDAAKKLAEEGKLQEAHEKALELPEGSSLRDHDDFKAIEGKWADWIFKQVEETDDLEQQYRMLHTIATTPTVDGERRSKAGEMLAKIEEEKPDLKDDKPTAWVPPRTTVPEDVYGDPKPPPAVGKTDDGTGTQTAASADVSDPKNYEAQKQALMPKVFGNKASKEEVQMLIALCKATADAACRNRAIQILKTMP